MAALPGPVWDRWLPQLESVELLLGEAVHESGATLSHVYFPTSAIVSLLYVMENGAAAEIAVVGDDGIVGVSVFMGGGSTTSRAVVQSAGHAFRLKAQNLMDEFNRNGPVLRVLDRVELEKRTCECYAVVRREYARLLPKPTPTFRR